MKSSLFLDRDGVLNERLPGAYVKNENQLKILPGVKEAIHFLKNYFQYCFVVTNQQGIGKKLMTEKDLELVHNALESRLDFEFDAIYYCPHLAEYRAFCRKPQPGMAYQAIKDFPDIDFSSSVMVGDTETDMQFAQAMGMKAIQIIDNAPSQYADEQYDSLLAFANANFNK